jgi:hypothetical protein
MPLDGCHPLQLSTTQKRAFAHDVSLLNIELLIRGTMICVGTLSLQPMQLRLCNRGDQRCWKNSWRK